MWPASDISHDEALPSNEDLQRDIVHLFEQLPDAILFVNRDWQVTYANEVARKMSGEPLGKNIWDVFPAEVRQASQVVDSCTIAMNRRLPQKCELLYGDPWNRWFSVEALPADGGGITIFFHDITRERNAADELQRKGAELERQAAELETLYRTAPVGLALFDPVEFRYVRLNDRQAGFFGLKQEDVLGRRLTEMAPIPGLYELFEQVRDGTSVVNYSLEGELISHPGEHRYWTVNYSPVRGPDGSVRAISAASLEITAQKKAERALVQSEKLAAVGRLASSISHEINNPLESVTNLLYLIGTHQGLPEDLKRYVELAQAELVRVVQIATQTLRFHRQVARPSQVTAEQLVRPVLNLYQGRLANSRVEVKAHFSDATQVTCLENEVRQVLSNLIGNAIDAMRADGGSLMLRAHRAVDAASGARGIRIVVADTGQGMSREIKRRIFEPFFTTKEQNGNGLGLWISSEIVQRHSGRLTVRSSQDPRFHGTAFCLFLPVSKDREEIAA